LVLYIRGEIREDDRLAIGLVGARYPSLYGLSMAERLARDLAAREFTIVSGLARGIDSASHRGALKAGGRTIAVLGSGVDRIYPPENKKLADEIINNGAVISEYPMGTIPDRVNFPKRNRIISGLSLGVCVVEAAQRSGSLITSTFALEQGRLVFAVPGRADSVKSEGTHNLIKEGAILVQDVEDIIKEIEPMLGGLKLIQDKTALAKSPLRNPSLPENEAMVLKFISREGLHIDELISKSKLLPGIVNACLLKLQLKGLIKECPGKIYILA
jgi:DNA processing protein